MKGLEAIIGMFKKSGGRFCIPAVELEKKILGVRGFVFDWDGVFHIGHKGEGHSGVFSESDSMGTNMLRYGYWRMHGELPFMAIISGEKDKTASMFAERECFHAVYTGIRDKKNALEHACGKVGVEPSRMGCVFDDINDLAMARYCGLRVQVRRSASPLFMEYTARGGDCDYITGHSAHEHAVREFCELYLGICGIFAETAESRIVFDNEYQAYWKARKEVKTKYYTWKAGKMEQRSL